MSLISKIRKSFGGHPVDGMQENVLAKADPGNHPGRHREIISDPLNILIERAPLAGFFDGSFIHLHNGNRVWASGTNSYYEDFSSILRYNRGVHEPLEEFVFQEVIRSLPAAPLMLELGAYWSHYSMWLKTARPAADVRMVEPDPNNLKVGKLNFELNGLDGTFMQGFVGDGQFEVDRYRAEQNINQIDILHSDIQGHEVEMLDSCRQSLKDRKINYLFVSTHSQELHGSVVELLEGSGYRVEISSDFDLGTTSYDGFVFASNPDLRPRFDGFQPLSRVQIAEASPELLIDYLTNTVRACQW